MKISKEQRRFVRTVESELNTEFESSTRKRALDLVRARDRQWREAYAGPNMNADFGPKSPAELRIYVDESDKVNAELLASVTKERDEAREVYHTLDKNWETHHEACMQPIRAALGLPDGSIGELVEKIGRLTELSETIAALTPKGEN